MYKFKFKDLVYKSNNKYNKFKKNLIIIPGLGCESSEYKYLLTDQTLKQNIFIFELPGHNFSPINFTSDYLYNFSKKLSLFIKVKNINNLTIYAHSMSCITTILLYRNFLKKFQNPNLVINEGNLIKSDCSNVTKKTSLYDIDFFINEGYQNLLSKCKNSKNSEIIEWYSTLKKVKAIHFYNYSKSCFNWSCKLYLLSYYKYFFKKKLYVFGEKSKNHELLEKLDGQNKFCIKNAGHFSHKYNKLIIKNILIKFLKS